MLNETIVWSGCAAASYLWLRAIVAPVVTAVRAYVHERRRAALLAVALAAAAALLWTVVPAAALLLSMMLEPRYGLALIAAPAVRPGLLAGVAAWIAHGLLEKRLPRCGGTFEAATAVAIVAAIDDDGRTLARVESLYRAMAIEGTPKVKTAPPLASANDVNAFPGGTLAAGSMASAVDPRLWRERGDGWRAP